MGYGWDSTGERPPKMKLSLSPGRAISGPNQVAWLAAAPIRSALSHNFDNAGRPAGPSDGIQHFSRPDGSSGGQSGVARDFAHSNLNPRLGTVLDPPNELCSHSTGRMGIKTAGDDLLVAASRPRRGATAAAPVTSSSISPGAFYAYNLYPKLIQSDEIGRTFCAFLATRFGIDGAAL